MRKHNIFSETSVGHSIIGITYKWQLLIMQPPTKTLFWFSYLIAYIKDAVMWKESFFFHAYFLEKSYLSIFFWNKLSRKA